jgi:nucleotide-binding universal stress UspA family protein
MRILALIDHSIYARSVVDYAAELAASTGAEVDLLHVLSRVELLDTTLLGYHPGGVAVLASNLVESEERTMSEARQRAETLLVESRASLLESGVSLVRTQVFEGEVSNAVQEAQVEASLIIMGKRGEHADFARLSLGGNVEQIVRAARCPVLLVPRSHSPITNCLVAFDRGDTSRSVVDTLARGRFFPALRCSLVHVGDTDAELDAALATAADELAAAGFATEVEVVPGHPEKVIPERVVLGKFDLVAMGAFGASRIKSLIFGSLTTEMVRATQTPVLLSR